MTNRHALLLLLVAVGGCASESTLAERSLPADTVEAELVARIGALAGPPEYLFGNVSGVAVGANGTVYVADRIGATVRAYDRSGRFLATMGKAGEGPGEFRYPNDITLDPSGLVYVRDMTRLTVFAPVSRQGGDIRVVRTTPLGSINGFGRGRADGRLYYHLAYVWVFRTGERAGYFYEVVDSAGPTGDTVAVPALANLKNTAQASYLVSDEGGLNLRGVNRAPFEPLASWDITVEGTIVATPGDRYRVTEWSAEGDSSTIIDLPVSSRPVPAEAARDSGFAFRARLDSIPVPLAQVRGMSDMARSGRLPDVLPAIMGIRVDLRGRIWLRRWPPPGQEDGATYFDVFDASGEPLRTVMLKALLVADTAPFMTDDYIVGVVRDPATDTQSVMLFRMPEGSR